MSGTAARAAVLIAAGVAFVVVPAPAQPPAVAAAAAVQTAARRSLVRGLDHVPIAVRDLDAAAETYRRMGFTLKPGTTHANGIQNLHAKFADGTELELITAREPRDDLRPHRARRPL